MTRDLPRALCGSRLNVASSVIRPLILFYGVTTAIYLFGHFRIHAGPVGDARERVRRSLVSAGVPCFLASFTTAIGFLSLTSSNVGPVREVGLYAAFGVMAAWLIGTILLPLALLRSSPPPAEQPSDSLAGLAQSLGLPLHQARLHLRLIRAPSP